jgi:hypothetical protein
VLKVLRDGGGEVLEVAEHQVQALAPQLAQGPVPLFVFDAGYSPALLTAALAQVRGALLVRFRDDRVFFRAAPAEARGQIGRPRRHGPAFRCGDAGTWGEPDVVREEQDAVCGHVEVRCWGGLHGRVVRMRMDGRTQAYVTRRTAEGLSTPEIMRCLKRYLAREVFSLLRADQPAAPA